MSDESIGYLKRQLDVAWALTSHHLTDLGDDECLWRPAPHGPHVHRNADGRFRADWPEHEGYDLGPPSIAWLTWHLGFWMSLVVDHSFGAGTLEREDVTWPGDAVSACQMIEALKQRWQSELDGLTDEDLKTSQRSRWPIRDRPFGDIVAWFNLELMKNASEIGYARFLFATRPR